MSNDRTPTYPAEHAEYLAEVHAREAAATEGDWGVYDQGTLVEIVAGLQDTGHGYRCRRQIARLDVEPIDNIPEHADWDEDQDYAQLLADATFAAKARTDVPRLLRIIAAQTARLEMTREFRIPLKNRHGGYAELTIERGPGPFDDRWAVTDGAHKGKRAWRNGSWHYLSDIGPALAYAHDMDAALTLGEEVAIIEGASLDAEVLTLQNAKPRPHQDGEQ